MEINLPVIVLAVLAAAALIAFLIYQNLKDEKKFEHDADAPVHKLHKGNDEERV